MERSQSEESGSQEAEGREETDHGGFDLPPSGATGHTVSRKAPNKLDKDTIIGVGKRVIGSVKEAVSNSLGPFLILIVVLLIGALPPGRIAPTEATSPAAVLVSRGLSS